ncbi:MAG: GNAT family N-acetyltransferase [Thermoanaerobaculales bacterium]
MLTFRILEPPVPSPLLAMTFPAYRHLLALQPAVRLQTDPGQPPVQPVAAAAWSDESPIGLAVADVPLDGPTEPELLSVFVTPSERGKRVGRGLVGAVEDEVSKRGFGIIGATYTAGRPMTGAVEQMLKSRGWSAPELRTLSVELSVAQAHALPWLHRIPVPGGCEIVPWVDITAEEKRSLKRSQENAGWIAPDLVPWRYESSGFEEQTSVGLRGPDGVLGWVINHRTSPDTVRFTCSYIRKDMGRRARILPLYSASIERLGRTEFSRVTFVAPMRHPTMAAFVRRRIEPYGSSVRETFGSTKTLSEAERFAVSPVRGADARGGAETDAVEQPEPIELRMGDPRFGTERGAS